MSFPDYNELSSFNPGQRIQIEQFISYLKGYLSAQHKDDGSHASITADDITIVKNTAAGTTGNLTLGGQIVGTGSGQNTVVGDLVALQGTGTECGMGVLSTVNGKAFESGEAARTGLLLGGVTNGFWLEVRAAGSPFDSGYEIRLWNLAWDSTNSALRFGITSSRPVLMDGGTGSTAIDLGSTSRYLHSVYAGQFFRSDYGSAQGEWTAVAYNSGNFTHSSGTWTVDVGDQLTLRYTLNGKTMTLTWYLVTTSVSGTAGTELRIAIPGSFTANARISNALLAIDNGAVTMARADAQAGVTYIRIVRQDGANWSNASTNATEVYGEITFEVQ